MTRSVAVDGGEVRAEIADGVAVLTVDRPGARNAISLATMDALGVALDWCADASALVISGGGDRAFVSGGDLKDLARLRSQEEAVAASPSVAIKRVIAAAVPHHHPALETAATVQFAALWVSDAHWTAADGVQSRLGASGAGPS
jgi:enoyl-CoA hydratase/carnithine racemase